MKKKKRKNVCWRIFFDQKKKFGINAYTRHSLKRASKSSIYDSVLFSLLYKDVILCSETQNNNLMITLHIIPFGSIDLIKFDCSKGD